MLSPLPTIGQNHLLQREYLVSRHVKMIEKILKENSHKDKYWILGWLKTKRRENKTKITPQMQVFDEMPELQKESYLYEVDNIAGTKTLLWVMHPNNKLSLPTLEKSMQVTAESGA